METKIDAVMKKQDRIEGHIANIYVKGNGIQNYMEQLNEKFNEMSPKRDSKGRFQPTNKKQ